MSNLSSCACLHASLFIENTDVREGRGGRHECYNIIHVHVHISTYMYVYYVIDMQKLQESTVLS